MSDPHGTPTGQKWVTNVTYSKSENKNGQTKSKANDSDKVCVIHGPGHSSEECWFIKREKKKLKTRLTLVKKPLWLCTSLLHIKLVT